MKKSLVVLLIAVLVAGYAFAAPTYAGKATATATYTLGAKPEFTYATADTLEATFTFAETLGKNVIGTAYPYINVAGSYELETSLDFQNIKQGLDIDTFEVVGEGWKLNLIAKSGMFDLAQSAIDTKKVQTVQYAEEVKVPYSLAWGVKDNAGIAYTNDNFGTIFVTAAFEQEKAPGAVLVEGVKDKAYYEAGVQAGWKNAYAKDGVVVKGWREVGEGTFVDSTVKLMKDPKEDSKVYDIVGPAEGTYGYVKSLQKTHTYENATTISDLKMAQVEAKTKEFAISDALTAQFAAGFCFEEGGDVEADGVVPTNVKVFGGSAKFAYNDVATIAADFGYDANRKINWTKPEQPFFFDVAGSLKVGVVTLDGYYATNKAIQTKDYTGTIANLTTKTDNPFGYASFKAVADIEEIGTEFTATVKDALNYGEAEINFLAENTYIPGYTFSVGLNDVLAFYTADPERLMTVALGVEAEYENGLTLGVSTEFNPLLPLKNDVAVSVAYASDDFEVSYEGGYNGLSCPKVADYKLTSTLKSVYHADKFDVVANGYYNTKLNKYAGVSANYDKVDPGLYAEAGIKTDKLVDGAEFSLMYKSGNLDRYYTDQEAAKFALGAIEAGLTITF